MLVSSVYSRGVSAMKGNRRTAGFFHLLWESITFSRLTLLYFVFTTLHFTLQLGFQIGAYTTNARSRHVIDSIIHDAGTINTSLPLLKGSRLYLCSWVPANLNTETAYCPIIWSGEENNHSSNAGPTVTTSPPVSSTAFPLMHTPKVLSAASSLQQEASDLLSLIATIMIPPQTAGRRNESAVTNLTTTTELTQECLWALNWPNFVLQNTLREDAVFIAFQFWVLMISIRALMNQSIPHIVASLLAHLLATIWGSFQIANTVNFRQDFKRVIIDGACKVAVLNPAYWDSRRRMEISSLTCNSLSLLITCALTWKLVKLFGWQTFTRVGASRVVNRVYKLVLSLSIVIQLSFFFMAVTVSLWIDQLMNRVIGDTTTFLTLYRVTSIVTLVLLFPWLVTGWFAVRRELQSLMLVFLSLSVLYLVVWGLMFFSTTFRWTFMTWSFFAVMASASLSLTVMAVILGTICRFNFGHGYHCSEKSQLTCDTVSPNTEKISFPSSEDHLPTFDFLGDINHVVFPPSAFQKNVISEHGHIGGWVSKKL